MSNPGTLLKRNIRTIAASGLTTSYQNVGAVTTIVGYKIAIVNATTTDVQISDGTTSDAYYIPAGSALSVGEGVLSSEGQASIKLGTQFQTKLPSGAAGTGTVVITIIGN